MAEESIFEAAERPNGEQNDEQKADSFLAKYVGEGKKYKDVEELAKAYDNANNFIPTLKSDMDALKEFTLEQLKLRADANNRQPNPDPDPNDETNKERQPAPNQAPPKEGEEKVDLDERIRQLMEERDETRKLSDNAKYAEEVMISNFGSKEAAVEAVRQKAAELDVSPQWLADTAFRSPKAFLTTMGITETKPRSTNTPNSESNINPRMVEQSFGGPKPNTYAWYDNIRKTDPKRYNSVQFQQQLMADAMRLGNDFFKR